MKKHHALTRSLAATAGALAAASSSDAALVKITLTGNYLTNKESGTGWVADNHLFADLTGDGNDDITLLIPSSVDWANTAKVSVNDGVLYASRIQMGYGTPSHPYYMPPTTTFAVKASFAPGGIGSPSNISSTPPVEATYFNPISFTDSRIGSGTLRGYLEVTSAYDGAPLITLSALYFDDQAPDALPTGFNAANATEWSAVPELSNGLTALALGAAGILRRRRRRHTN